MKQWAMKFLDKHGERLIFGMIATIMATAFRFIGLIEASNVILTGVAMLMFNKTRGPENNKENPAVE